LEVPTLLNLTGLKRAVPPADAVPRRARSAWGRRQQVMLVGLAITAVGALWAGWEVWARPPRLEITSLRPAAAVIYWTSLKQGVAYRMPFEIIYAARLDENNRWLIVTGVVIGLGLLTVALSPLSSTRRKPGGVTQPVPGKRVSGPGARRAEPRA
jgi:hypothetical protein